MYKVYILKSEKNNRHYIGHSDNLKIRIEAHNNGAVRSTKTYKPWKIIYTEDAKNKNEAYKKEQQIKSYKGGEAFKKLVSGYCQTKEECQSG